MSTHEGEKKEEKKEAAPEAIRSRPSTRGIRATPEEQPARTAPRKLKEFQKPCILD